MFGLLIPATLALATVVLGPTVALARGGCLLAEDYLKDGANASNRQMASAIACLAGSLGPADAAPTARDQDAAEKILLLANKIIGTGAPVAGGKPLIGAGAQPAIASLAGGQGMQTGTASRTEVAQAAATIICIVSVRYLADRQIDPDLLAHKGTCPADGDAREQIRQAFKIIGNG